MPRFHTACPRDRHIEAFGAAASDRPQAWPIVGHAGRLLHVGAGGKLTPLRRLKIDPLERGRRRPGVADPGLVVVIERGEGGVLDVERWAELRREHFVRGVAIKELVRRNGIVANTVRRGVPVGGAAGVSASAGRVEARSVQGRDPRLLGEDPRLSGVRVRELIEPLGFDGGKTIVDDYLREVRPLFLTPRTYQRTIYRPGEICQFDLWQPDRRRCRSVMARPARRGWWSRAWGIRARALAR